VKLVKRLYEQADVSTVLNVISRNNERVFRVRVSHEGQLIGIPKKIQARIEQEIIHKTPYTLDPVRSDLEFWFLIRRDGHAYFGMKEVLHQKKKEKGALSDDLAYLLCWLADLDESDILLDPFAGYGSIPFTAVRHFSCKQIIASDYDGGNVHKMKHAQTHLKKKIQIQNWDVLHLGKLGDQSVDVIVTDPPWGIYKKTDFNIKKFYRMMLEELCRVVKKDGILIILTSQKQLLEEIIDQFEDTIETVDTYHILVSGKKAGVYKLRRI
jgi:tRNA G10  N-methylase Trm11